MPVRISLAGQKTWHDPDLLLEQAREALDERPHLPAFIVGGETDALDYPHTHRLVEGLLDLKRERAAGFRVEVHSRSPNYSRLTPLAALGAVIVLAL